MKIINAKEWNNWVTNNPDGMGKICIDLAEELAERIEGFIPKCKTILDAIKKGFKAHCKQWDNPTLMQMGYVGRILNKSWKYGKEFVEWHNSFYD